MVARMVIAQRPHHVTVVVHVHHVGLCYGAHAVHAVPQRVVHIPGTHEWRFISSHRQSTGKCDADPADIVAMHVWLCEQAVSANAYRMCVAAAASYRIHMHLLPRHVQAPPLQHGTARDMQNGDQSKACNGAIGVDKSIKSRARVA